MMAPAWPIVFPGGAVKPGDVPDDRLGDVGLDEVGRPLLRVAADLADHHDGVGVGVGLERGEGIDVGRPDDRVATDADGRGETDVAQLVHHLVGQRARLRDQADPARAGDVGRDDARVGLAGAGDARAVRPDDARLVAGRDGVRPEGGRVVDRDALGDDNRQRDAARRPPR